MWLVKGQKVMVPMQTTPIMPEIRISYIFSHIRTRLQSEDCLHFSAGLEMEGIWTIE